MFTLNCKGRLLVIDKPIIMGILNINPDSFYAGSRFNESNFLKKAEQMIHDGAKILDVGGQSTKPGSLPVSAIAERARVIPVIETLNKTFPETIISIDTFYSLVARDAIAAGASIVNDISAGNFDEDFLDTVAALNVPYILMHMQGRPATMQQDPRYADVTKEVMNFFVEKLAILRGKGIKDIIVDPGFGFGKTAGQNFTLLKNIGLFQALNCPVLLGVSRKGSIYKTLGTDAEHALNGTTVLHTIGLCSGVNIVRVHDVKEAVDAVKLVDAVYGL